MSGRGSAISSAKEGKSGFIYNLVKSFEPLQSFSLPTKWRIQLLISSK